MSSRQIKEEFVKFGKLQGLLSANQIEGMAGPFQVTEKIDGGNSQIRNLEGRLIGGSRANYLHGPRLRSRPWFGKFNAWIHNNTSLYKLHKDLVLFGEWSGNHTIDYGENNDQFFMLDLVDIKNGAKSMPYDLAQGILADLGVTGINFLQTLASGDITGEELNNILLAPSNYYDGPKEGVVLRNNVTGQRLKLYHPDYAEKVLLDGDQIDYLTPARFRKAIFYLVDETKKKKVSMGDVVEAVKRDVVTEEGRHLETSDIGDRFYSHLSSGKLLKAAEHLGNL